MIKAQDMMASAEQQGKVWYVSVEVHNITNDAI